ncbi:chorismate-binding protein [Desulfobacter postgatei]|uniref:chorismate-binding protein n=1 Tax=Desulfobacter postgatei TaxID=2293 RepID=UPI000308691B|nr:chorismate-binding protein [Desulfobacter postgatei]
MFKKNPAPFFAFVQTGDHQVVSTSPERFLKVAGHIVETRPIKGTIARGARPEQDRENARILSLSTKEDAELTMILDLMRNV